MQNSPTSPKHTLVVGGTGMLRDAALALALRGGVVSVIAQSPDRLDALARDAALMGGRINPLSVDYGNDEQLALALFAARQDFGPIQLGVCWIHDDAPRALPIIAEALRGQSPPARLFNLVGSAAADPSLEKLPNTIAKDFPDIAWRRLVLGFVMRGKSSKWLGHDQICKGTLDAIDHDWEESIVGMTKPWGARPR